jgi:Flp pilus assembly protein TadG
MSRHFLPLVRPFVRDTRGAAAAEFVLWLAVLGVPLLSVVDLGVFALQKMQLELASQASVQTAWHRCDTPAKLPATRNCTGLASAMATAAQSTSLGTAVTIAEGSPVEGYYCTDGGGPLQVVGATGTIASPLTATRPNCSTVTTGSTTPAGDYIKVTVNYTYTPVFAGVSIASLLPTTITRTAWMRLS